MSNWFPKVNLTQFIPGDHQALVPPIFFGKERVVTGPARVFTLAPIRFFQRVAIEESQRASIYDRDGRCESIPGPVAIQVHPEGRWINERKILLASNEAAVIICEDGSRRYLFGKKKEGLEYGEELPSFFLSPSERVHCFSLTGGGNEDGLGKKPRELKIEVVRMSPTQAYFAVPVRTKTDHTPLILKLMIFFQIDDLKSFVENSDDPFGVMFNHIMSKLVATVSNSTFDEFKVDPQATIKSCLNEEALKEIAKFGIKISDVILRGWNPMDEQIQRVLNEAAVVNTKKEIANAQHEARMQQIGHEKEELIAKAANDKEQQNLSTANGTRKGAELAAMVSSFKAGTSDVLNQEQLANILALMITADSMSKGGTLCLPPELLKVSQPNSSSN